jgi:peroxiredoxin
MMLVASAALAQQAKAPQRPQEGKLAVGDLAPDFELTVRGGEQKVRLSSFRGRRPVALVFGSYT